MSQDEGAPPEVVDFDALHAALGELPPAPTSSSPSIGVGESQGRSSATYSSARPHTIPPTRAPDAGDMNAPAVIVASEDTAPTGPPQQMTVPMAGAPPFGAGVSGGSGPHPAAGGRSPSPSNPFAPQPFAAEATPQPPENLVQMTVQMPTRPRRPRTPTIVVRTRGPTKQQKLLVFMAMLLVFVGGGIAFLIYGNQLGFNIDGRPAPSSARPPAPVVTPAVTAATTTATTTVLPAATVIPSTTALPTPLPTPPSAAPSSTPAPSGKKTARPR